MSDDKTYNGWTKYETWIVNLWMDNEEGSQTYWLEQARDYLDVASTHTAIVDFADRLQEAHEETMPETEGMWVDLQRAAFSEVCWVEIASSWIARAREDRDYKRDPVHDEAANRADDQRMAEEGQ